VIVGSRSLSEGVAVVIGRIAARAVIAGAKVVKAVGITAN
jgi:hypothetical protein